MITVHLPCENTPKKSDYAYLVNLEATAFKIVVKVITHSMTLSNLI